MLFKEANFLTFRGFGDFILSSLNPLLLDTPFTEPIFAIFTARVEPLGNLDIEFDILFAKAGDRRLVVTFNLVFIACEVLP